MKQPSRPPSAGTRVASTWLRSRIREVAPRTAKDDPSESSEAGFHLFQRPEDRKKPESEADFHLFQRPEERKKPKAEPPRAPAKKPEAPAKKPEAPAKKPESGPDEGDMRRDPLFDKFLDEKYQGGEQRVPNPNPDARDRYPDVAFSTAMKDSGFRRQVHLEFERWKGELEKDKAPEGKRIEIGQKITDLSQLRVGDVIQSDRPGAPMRRIMSINKHFVQAQNVDEDGNLGDTYRLPASSITMGSHKRVQDPATPTGKARREEAKKREDAEKQQQAEAKKREDAARRERQEKALEEAAKRHEKLPHWAKAQEKLLDIARNGHVTQDRQLGGGVNETSVRTIQLGDTSHRFVWKPKSGEAGGYRAGIDAGTYHQREAASYGIDRLLGEGTVVPPTMTNGDGSYQAFENGAETFLSRELDFPDITTDELTENPDFHRINVLDAILGHEDRHPGNIMMSRDSSRPGGYRFIAIDNGLALADPSKKMGAGEFVAREPWSAMFGVREALAARRRGAGAAKMKEALAEEVARVGKVVGSSTHKVSPELHERLKKVDPEEFVQTMVDSGIRNRAVIRAALVRLAAIQRNPEIIGKLAKWSRSSDHLEGMRAFLHMSGYDPQKILELAGGEGPSFNDLDAVVTRALR